MDALTLFLLVFARTRPDLPPVTDLDRFPSEEACEMAISFSEQLQSNFDNRRQVERWRWQEYSDAIGMSRKIEDAWKDLRWIHWAQRYGTNSLSARRGLSELRETIGPDAYALGIMPPPSPVVSE